MLVLQFQQKSFPFLLLWFCLSDTTLLFSKATSRLFTCLHTCDSAQHSALTRRAPALRGIPALDSTSATWSTAVQQQLLEYSSTIDVYYYCFEREDLSIDHHTNYKIIQKRSASGHAQHTDTTSSLEHTSPHIVMMMNSDDHSTIPGASLHYENGQLHKFLSPTKNVRKLPFSPSQIIRRQQRLSPLVFFFQTPNGVFKKIHFLNFLMGRYARRTTLLCDRTKYYASKHGHGL